MADSLDQIDEQAAIEAELKRLKQDAPPEPPEGTDTGIPPIATEEEKKPLVEVKPESEEPPKPEEPKPPPKPEPEKTPEERAREGTLRRLLRERDREIAELRRQVSPPAEEKKDDKPKAPTYEDDPAEYLKGRLDAQAQEIERLRGEKQQQDALALIRQQEADFERQHPDYKDALKHLEEREVRLWEKSGFANAQVGQLKEAVRQARNGNQQLKPYADHLDKVSQREDVVALAEKEGREPEDVAAWVIARDTYMVGRRQQVWEGAQALGRNAAEIAYELATDSGYHPVEQGKPADTGEAARQRVLQAKQISEASRSLSESATGESGGEGPRVIRNRSQVLQLNDDELDALIASDKFREL